MKIALVTTLPGLAENERIKDEVFGLGHKFELVDLSGFSYSVDENGLSVPGLTDLEADIVVFRGIFLSLKAISAAAELLRRNGVKIFDNSLLKHEYSINKIADTAKLAREKIPTVKTYYARNFDNYLEKANEYGFPVVVKLTRAGKGAGIYKIDDETRLKEFIDNVQNEGYKASSYLLQEYFDYEHDLRILVIGGAMFTMKRIPPEGDFRANFSLGGSVEVFSADDETRQIALDALKAIDMTVGGVDVLIDKNGRKIVLEVNHTPGMVGMEEATKENITKKYVEHVIEKAR